MAFPSLVATDGDGGLAELFRSSAFSSTGPSGEIETARGVLRYGLFSAHLFSAHGSASLSVLRFIALPCFSSSLVVLTQLLTHQDGCGTTSADRTPATKQTLLPARAVGHLLQLFSLHCTTRTTLAVWLRGSLRMIPADCCISTATKLCLMSWRVVPSRPTAGMARETAGSDNAMHHH